MVEANKSTPSVSQSLTHIGHVYNKGIFYELAKIMQWSQGKLTFPFYS